MSVLSDAGSTPAASTTLKLLMFSNLLLFLASQLGTNQVQLSYTLATNCW